MEITAEIEKLSQKILDFKISYASRACDGPLACDTG